MQDVRIAPTRPSDCGVGEELKPMSLIVAAKTESEVVIAADTYGFWGDVGGYFGFRQSKLHKLYGKWVLGITGSQAGFNLHSRIEAESFAVHSDLRIAAGDYAVRMDELYRQGRYKGEAKFLLCGIQDALPLIYFWQLPEFAGVRQADNAFWGAGLTEHGAFYILSSYYSPQMSTEQLVLLEYFTVLEVAKADLRVRAPIEVVIVRENDVIPVQHLSNVEREAEAIGEMFRGRFKAPGPYIDGL